MSSRSLQSLLYVPPLRIRGTNRILPVRQGNVSVGMKIDDDLRLARKAVHMARRMIVRISDESNSAEP